MSKSHYLLHLAVCVSLYGQQPPLSPPFPETFPPFSPIFPSRAVTDADLGLRLDACISNLAGSIGATDMQFSLTDASACPNANFIVQVETELIFISSRVGSLMNVSTRGYAGTSAVGHFQGLQVVGGLYAPQWNRIVAEVEATQIFALAHGGGGVIIPSTTNILNGDGMGGFGPGFTTSGSGSVVALSNSPVLSGTPTLGGIETVPSGAAINIASGGALTCAIGATCPGGGTIPSNTNILQGNGTGGFGAGYTASGTGTVVVLSANSALAGPTTLGGSSTVPSGSTLTIASGGTLTCASGSTCPGGGATAPPNTCSNFGVDRTGATDSTVALQNCINSLAPGGVNDGGMVIVEPSTAPNNFYLCTGLLTWGSVIHGSIWVQTGAALQGCALPASTAGTWVEDWTTSSKTIYGTLSMPNVTTAVRQSYQICPPSLGCSVISSGVNNVGAKISPGGFWFTSVAALPPADASGVSASIGSSGSPVLLYAVPPPSPFLLNFEFCHTITSQTNGTPGTAQLSLVWTDVSSNIQTSTGPVVALGSISVNGGSCFMITPKASTTVSFYVTYTSAGTPQYGVSGFLKPQ